MINRLISASLAITALASGSTPVQANPDGTFSIIPKNMLKLTGTIVGKPEKRFLGQLNLSEQQKQQIATIRQKYNSNIAQTQNKFRTSQQELRQLLTGDAPEQAIRAKHEQVRDLRQELETLRFESMLEIRDVLTTAQRQELSQMMQQRRAERRIELAIVL